MSTKGSWQRPDVDKGKFLSEYDRIFKKKEKQAKPTKEKKNESSK